MNVRTNLLLPKDLVAEVDRYAGQRGRSRYVADALRERLRRDRLRDAVRGTAGVLSAEDYPHWATPELVQAWVRERRDEVTGPGADED
jgi:metal-responsive CopG/Arc/MetJ family transcriptional regulator